MLRRAGLAAYVVSFSVILELWPAIAESPRRELFFNEAIGFAGVAVLIPFFLGMVLGALRRGDRVADYMPFVLGPIGAFALRDTLPWALLDEPFDCASCSCGSWHALPRLSVRGSVEGSLSSFGGAGSMFREADAVPVRAGGWLFGALDLV